MLVVREYVSHSWGSQKEKLNKNQNKVVHAQSRRMTRGKLSVLWTNLVRNNTEQQSFQHLRICFNFTALFVNMCGWFLLSTLKNTQTRDVTQVVHSYHECTIHVTSYLFFSAIRMPRDRSAEGARKLTTCCVAICEFPTRQACRNL